MFGKIQFVNVRDLDACIGNVCALLKVISKQFLTVVQCFRNQII